MQCSRSFPLLPLYFTLASDGLDTLLRQRVPPQLPAVAAASGVAAAGLATLTSGSIPSSPDTGRFVDAESIASALSGRLSTGDAVVTLVPASAPELEYYF